MKKKEETMLKAVRLPLSTIKSVEDNADDNGRDFSSEVRYALKKYYKSIGVK